ncbi:inhibitor of Bruton tyrosine kinase [Contarinia nasturtii]|uniref:inhibitor of Bruton tyrosine kinase n=1 Tax=Contarinia nasturtii TaxID=265458 RepID=UPI0012D4B84D|nr:inhibitor of Bruton tyrosine kinase [Contarinia nasturtii]
MFNISNFQYENCGKKCKNPEHSERITGVLLNNSLPDDKIAAFIAKTCRNFAHNLNHQGQTALHAATAGHKYAVVEWLINNGADVNLPDKQLGQTALHRAINNGYFDIALLLLNYGASFEINDFKLKAPVQYCCKPKNYVHEQSQIKEQDQQKEILVWGNNRNYNLGLEDKEGKSYPHNLDCFSKQNVSINSVSLSCYHCLYVDDKGELYAVGLGDGGRLGTNNETTLVLPRKIYLTNKHKNERVISVSTARNHSIVLTNDGRIFTCGLNTHMQLGQRNPIEKSLIMREIDIGDRGHFNGVIARDYHCLAYTSNSVYVWGTNCGQFGLPIDDVKPITTIAQPKKLETFSHDIAYVDSTNGAIVVLTTSGLMLLYTNHKVKTLKKPILHESIKHIAVVGGNSTNMNTQEKGQSRTKPSVSTHEKFSTSDPLEILVLTQSDTLFLWSNDEQKYLRCFMAHSFSIKNVYWCNRMVVLILATDGILYKGTITRHSVNPKECRGCDEEFVEINRRMDISETHKCDIVLTRIPNIDRVTNCSVDQNGESFVALQEYSKRYLFIPHLPDDPITFKALLNETSEFDLLHDIVFHVEDEVFPAHKYIVYSRAEGLREIVRKYKDKHIYLNYDGLTSKMFELMMRYIYENYTLSMTDIEDVESSFDPYSGLTNLDIYTLFREYMGKFGVSKLFDRLMTPSEIKESPLKLNRLSFPELYDVTIQCANDRDIKAHRCILSTRLEYFNLMFNSHWSESQKDVINLKTIPFEYMEPVINFLYHNDTNLIRKKDYTDSFLYGLMEICDQFFVTRLKNIIEIMMIERMTLKKCADMYEFATVFNCSLLESASLDFICQNMSRLLENRCLEHLQIESMEKISEYYRQVFQISENGEHVMSTVFGGCIRDEDVISFVDDFYVDLFQKKDTVAKSATISTTTKPKKTERLSSDRRNYEKEAINLVKNLSIEENTATKQKQPVIDDSIIIEAEEIARSFTTESTKWMKVTDKKDVKKKIVLAGLKSNDVLRNEPKELENFTPLKSSKTMSQGSSAGDQSDLDKSTTPIPIESPSEKSSTFNLSLGDFTPQKGTKLSQKQRRRQLSQSEKSECSPSSIKHTEQSPSKKTVAWNASTTSTPEQTNVWKVKSTPDATVNKTQPINIASTSKANANHSNASFNESFYSLSPIKSSVHSGSNDDDSTTSFTKILVDERRQKEYYNKMKSKSLLLTQIEETAIDELKKFYNIDNVCDEHIEIERKPHVTATVNFAKWKHN